MTASKAAADPRGGPESPSTGIEGAARLGAGSPRAEQIAAWRRTIKLWAVVLFVSGVAGLFAGSLWLGRTTTYGGYWLGSAGVLAIVLGAFCARLAAAGPLPKRLTENTP